MTCDNNNPFGHYTNLEERLQELANRLFAWLWSDSTGEEVPSLFLEAQRKLAARLREFDPPVAAPKELVLEAFESALADFDNILREFPVTPPNWVENEG